MALWQIMRKGKPQEQWDDGATTRPGDEGFSTEAVSKQAEGDQFNYMGTPNWAPPETEEPQDE